MSRKEKKTAAGKKTHRLRKVLLIILAVLAVLILGSFAACKIMSIPGEPVVEQFSDAEERAAAASSAGEPLAAQEALTAPDGEIYQSISATGWEQTGDTYDKVEDPSWYETSQPEDPAGNEASELLNSCYGTCHKEGSFDSYEASYEEAKAKTQSMVDDYGCDLTEEQVESLAHLLAESE